eukprot:1195685-Prorocentrum_minimum.AAC.2
MPLAGIFLQSRVARGARATQREGPVAGPLPHLPGSPGPRCGPPPPVLAAGSRARPRLCRTDR